MNYAWLLLQTAGVALSKLAKAEKVTSAGLALLSSPAEAQTAATKLTTGRDMQRGRGREGGGCRRRVVCVLAIGMARQQQQSRPHTGVAAGGDMACAASEIWAVVRVRAIRCWDLAVGVIHAALVSSSNAHSGVGARHRLLKLWLGAACSRLHVSNC
jgi:hypothetical protein